MYFTSISDNIFNICLWHKSNIAPLQCAHIFGYLLTVFEYYCSLQCTSPSLYI